MEFDFIKKMAEQLAAEQKRLLNDYEKQKKHLTPEQRAIVDDAIASAKTGKFDVNEFAEKIKAAQ